jgi:hypothetical protein
VALTIADSFAAGARRATVVPSGRCGKNGRPRFAIPRLH